jgi:hypothetical protein
MNFSRITSFLNAGPEIEVNAHNEDLTQRSSHMAQFLKNITLATLVGIATLGGLSTAGNAIGAEIETTYTPIVQNIAQVMPTFRQTQNKKLEDLKSGKSVVASGSLNQLIKNHPDEYAAIKEITEFHSKYMSEGRSNIRPIYSVEAPNNVGGLPEAMQYFSGESAGACVITHISNDYSHFYSNNEHKYDVLTDKTMRAYASIHENAHCNTMSNTHNLIPFDKMHPMVKDFLVVSREAMADAMAILTIARVDGLADAQHVLDARLAQSNEYRSDDPDHDVAQTLNIIQDVLDNHPEKYSTDTAAFKTATEAGIDGSLNTIAMRSSTQRKAKIMSFLKDETAPIVAGYNAAVDAHSKGNYSQSTLQIDAKNINISQNSALLPVDLSAKPTPKVSDNFLSILKTGIKKIAIFLNREYAMNYSHT